jgi:agmatinase
VLHDGHFLLWVTGNHLGALPVYEELGSRAGSLVVQFDAHLDIQQFADSTPRPSHGNFLLHAKGPLPEIVNVGHRDLLLAAEAVKATYRATFPAEQLAVDPAPILRQLRQRAARAERVFLDIDCDVFDPAFFPAVSHPLPFGLAPADFLRLLDAAWNDKVAGIAISEFDPGRDRDDRSLAILVWLLEYVLLRHAEGR